MLCDLGGEIPREHVVNLSTAEANTRRLEHSVRTAQHDQTACARVEDADEIPVVPDGAFDAANVGETLKVRRLVLVVAARPPEGERLRRERAHANEVALRYHATRPQMCFVTCSASWTLRISQLLQMRKKGQ